MRIPKLITIPIIFFIVLGSLIPLIDFINPIIDTISVAINDIKYTCIEFFKIFNLIEYCRENKKIKN